MALLCGGLSEEREVSLRTGKAVGLALKQLGYEVTEIDMDQNSYSVLKDGKFDLAYIALHGKFGEDGIVQGILELLKIPYTGPGVLASSLAINKIRSKEIFLYNNLPTAKFISFKKYELAEKGIETLLKEVKENFELPVVVKAPTQGSTIGIYFVHQWEELAKSLEDAFTYDPEIMVEEFIKGVEVTASVLGNAHPRCLPLIEIVSNTGVYDYEAKYTVGLSEHIMPPRISEDLQETIKKVAVEAYLALGCRGLSRIDFIVDAAGTPYILEANTSPGMTETSLFPDAAREAGMDFTQLVEEIVKLALED